MSFYTLRNLRVPVAGLAPDLVDLDSNLKPFIATECGVPESAVLDYQIANKGIDARIKAVFIGYTVHVELSESPQENEKLIQNDSKWMFEADIPAHSPKEVPKGVIVVGTGPAGLCAAWLLAHYGCDPVVIDRGFDVDRRTADICHFMETGKLDINSNFLIGEGGAGAYSDGKLYTRTKDPLGSFVLKLFADHGAPEEILYLKRPHIGSDKLPGMVKSIREQIISMGGTFITGREVTGVFEENGRCGGVVTVDGEKLHAPAVILAHGLGGRHLTENLVAAGIDHALKDFQLGTRIEHKQSMVNYTQYGTSTPHPCLGAAEYNLVSRPPKQLRAGNVSSFCMCPGGIIVPSTAEEGRFSTNGMSRFARNGKFANSCLIVNQSKEDFATPAEAFMIIRELESQAYFSGGGGYTAPAQDAAAFVNEHLGLSKKDTSYCFGMEPARIDEMLPKNTARSLRVGLKYFEKVFPGFMTQGTLVGIESYISSPVRFLRDKESLQSSLPGLYLSGEGAGNAGGIMSAAVDGLKIAGAILDK
jgi:uncharacterized FAD-dependent dehydrogenase